MQAQTVTNQASLTAACLPHVPIEQHACLQVVSGPHPDRHENQGLLVCTLAGISPHNVLLLSFQSSEMMRVVLYMLYDVAHVHPIHVHGKLLHIDKVTYTQLLTKQHNWIHRSTIDRLPLGRWEGALTYKVQMQVEPFLSILSASRRV